MTVNQSLNAPATGPGPTARRHGRARLVVGYLAIAAILPYFLLKLAWLAGSTVGIATTSPIDADVLRGGNAVTMALEVVAAFIILAFTHSWGLRAPAWLVLAPAWVGTGLLAPFILTGPVVAGSGSAGDGSLEPWVGPLVYLGFGAQAVGIVVSFVLYVRARWPQALGGRVQDRSGGPYQPALDFLLAVMIVLFAVVGAALGMTENNIGAAQIGQHQRADVAGMRAFGVKMTILRAESNSGSAQGFFDGGQQRKRRTDQKFALRFAQSLDLGGNTLGQSRTVGRQTVHFPVTCNQFFTSHLFVPLLSKKNMLFF